MIKANSPKKQWDDCIELEMEIRSCKANNVFEPKGEVPRTVMKGETANITHLCEFGWYDWVYFRDNAVTYHNDKWVLGKWLGSSTDIGPVLCAKILKDNGRCVYISSYRHLTEDEQNSPEEKKKRESYDQLIHSKLGSAVSTQDFEEDYSTPEYELYEDDDGMVFLMPEECEDEPTPTSYDTYIGAEVVCQKEMTWFLELSSQESRILRDSPLGRLIRIQSWTQGYTMLNALMVRLQNWVQTSFRMHVSQCDIEGNQYRLMDQIVDHRKDGQAVSKDNQEITLNGKTNKQKTTRGWQLCIEWKDKSTSWERLSDMKESYPVLVVEYAEAMGISDEPAFSWWTTHV